MQENNHDWQCWWYGAAWLALRSKNKTHHVAAENENWLLLLNRRAAGRGKSLLAPPRSWLRPAACCLGWLLLSLALPHRPAASHPPSPIGGEEWCGRGGGGGGALLLSRTESE